MAGPDQDEITLRLATEIVVAYLTKSSIDPNDLPALVRQIRLALSEDLAPGEPLIRDDRSQIAEAPSPVSTARKSETIAVNETVTPDYLVCLEDGHRFKSLKRHLKARYGMTPEEYRRKWGLPDDYPMVAPNYSQVRSRLAKMTGFSPSPPSRKKA